MTSYIYGNDKYGNILLGLSDINKVDKFTLYLNGPPIKKIYILKVLFVVYRVNDDGQVGVIKIELMDLD